MNNQKSICKYQIVSAIFVAVLGTLLHFTFGWSSNNPIVGAFSAVNESTWEHLKLLFFPMLISIIIGCFYFRNKVPNLICAKTIGILISILFTIVFFYTSSGIIGKNIDILNIATFYIAVILGEYVAYRIMISNLNCNRTLSIIILSILFLCFIAFTYQTPQIGIFKDPITGTYGI